MSAVLNCFHPPESWHAVDNTNRTYWEYTRWIHREMLKQVAPGEKDSAPVHRRGYAQARHGGRAIEEIWVQAWVTAGVKTNALRVGRDAAYGIERQDSATFQP